jgi:NAD(P)-dependent dehydrogenase (short-subunit alcohol dehydrogenase family)
MPFRHPRRPPPRRALVTGASSGIGAAFARTLSSGDLLLAGRDGAALRELAGEPRRDGRAVETVAADLAAASTRSRRASSFRDLTFGPSDDGRRGPAADSSPRRRETASTRPTPDRRRP